MEGQRSHPRLGKILARKAEEKKAASSQKIQPEHPPETSQAKKPLPQKEPPSESTSDILRSIHSKILPPKRGWEQQARLQEPPAKKARVENDLNTKQPSPPKPVPKKANRNIASQAVQPSAKRVPPTNSSPIIISSPPMRRSLRGRIRLEAATRAETLQKDNKLSTEKAKPATESLPSPKVTNSSGEPGNKTSSAVPSLSEGQRYTQSSNHPFVFRSTKIDGIPPLQVQRPKTPRVERVLLEEHDLEAVPLSAKSAAPLSRWAPLTANNVASLDPPFHEAGNRTESKKPQQKEDPDEVIKALKQAYSTSAKSLQIGASQQIEQTYSKLEKKLQETTKNDSNFLNKFEKQIETISTPLSGFTIQSEQRAADGTVFVKTSTIAELVSTTEAQVNELKTDIRRLWDEWAAADAEARAMYNEAVNPKDTQAKDGAPSTSTATAAAGGGASISPSKEAGPLEQAYTILEELLEDTAEQINRVSDTSLEVIKEIEKEFVKKTMPDLHFFYKSIEMP